MEQTPIFTMKSKNFLSRKRKKSKKKSKVESPVEKKIPRKRLTNLLTKIKESLKKNYLDRSKAFKKFILIVIGYGFIINYALYFIFQIKFSVLSFPAWGIAYYFISDEFVEWFRRLIAKR